ncbi:MAG TPA: trypsin-like peptidase domain-containing protein [Chloroflexota bacterium]|nr:trypsin-like peptidase domain-containing protein [Chloroflexota bacterium]
MPRYALPVAAAGLITLGTALGIAVRPLFSSTPVVAKSTKVRAAHAATDRAAAPAITADSIDTAIQNAYNRTVRSVVYVNNVGNGTGSGVIFDANGDIVTNAHVVSGASTIRVTLHSGRILAATIKGTDTADDLAVIHVNATGLPAAAFAASAAPAEAVLAIGNPLGLQSSVTFGVISGLNRVEQEPSGAYLPNAIQTSAPINPGNSGGALVALDGRVVGIPTMVQTSAGDGTPAQDVGFAIPSSRVVTVARQIIAAGKVQHTGRAYLGVSAGDGSSGQGNGSGPFSGGGSSGSNVQGAIVNQVGSGTPAARAGIQSGDVITGVNGMTISSSDDLLTALARAHPGQTVNVTLNRNGTNRTLRVTLGEMPANQ